MVGNRSQMALCFSAKETKLPQIAAHYFRAYEQAAERAERGELTYSLDEMIGIQALERTMPDLDMTPGCCENVEFEYIRHGTQTLIASLNVATAQIDQASVEDTRTDTDLVI